MAFPQKPDDESGKILDRVERESEVLGTSSLARSTRVITRRWTDHFMGKDLPNGTLEQPQNVHDPIEIWGKRIGRSLSLILCVFLVYLLGQQLKFW
jgi:hypothetical protein